MRKIVIASLIMAAVVSACRSTPPPGDERNFSDFYSSYRNREGFSTMSLPPALINMVAGRDNPEIREMLRDLDEIRIITYSKSADSAVYYADRLRAILTYGNYSDLVISANGDEQIEIRTIGDDETVTELVMITAGGNGFMAMGLKGKMCTERVRDIPRHLNPSTLRQLEQASPFSSR